VLEGRKNIVGSPSKGLSQRHPRTAFCYNPQKIIFTVVDGRQPQLSVGMTLDELADLMVELGCTTAMNSDGGGSSVMAVRGEAVGAALQVVNSPSDGQERGRGNAWIVVVKK
jgi:exopolysaccharide biosynthesis protein